MTNFLPVTKRDMENRGWQQVDFVIVTGDAYVDHPSFGTALISRMLSHFGYKIAVLPQPDWRSTEDFKRFGRPRLGFMVNSGNVDSMVNHYSVFKHRRHFDIYSPGGKKGKRPDRAVIVYSNRIREAYGDVPIILGGLEASLRRMAHYDYWDDAIRRSILLDSRADILLYGMGERATLEVAEALDSGIACKDISWIRGTCIQTKDLPEDAILLPSFQQVKNDKKAYADSFAIQYSHHDAITAKSLAEPYDNGRYILQNPPQPILTRMDMDDLYALPFERNYHPMYEKDGGIPAIKEVRFSITANRGCFGGCAFCALTYHQGRQVVSRSKDSVVKEAEIIRDMPDFKGYIHDIGGPSANFSMPACKKQETKGVCSDKDCLYPKPCKAMIVDHSDCLSKLQAVRQLPEIKKVFVRSGIRFDYTMADTNKDFLKELCQYHVSGTLKVAPEHTQLPVLSCMRKPSVHVYDAFKKAYDGTNKKLGKEQYLIPYLISSHPGSTLDDAIDMALYFAKEGFIPDQVQDFYPTPGTLATCMYYTGIDPLTRRQVYVARDPKEKKMQRALLHFHKKENRSLVMEALHICGREEEANVLFGNHTQRSKKNTKRKHRRK